MYRQVFIGAKEQAAFKEILSRSVMLWSEDWSCSHGPSEVVSIQSNLRLDPEFLDESKIWSTESGALVAIFGEDESSWRSMVFGEFSSDLPHDDTAMTAISAAKKALVSSLLGCLPETLTLSSSIKPEVRKLLWTKIALTIKGSSLLLCIPNQFVGRPRSGGHVKSNTGSMLTKKLAVQRSPCTMSVSFGLGNIPVERLLSLRVGQILETDVECERPVDLSLSGAHLLSGRLCRLEKKKAIYISRKVKNER